MDNWFVWIFYFPVYLIKIGISVTFWSIIVWFGYKTISEFYNDLPIRRKRRKEKSDFLNDIDNLY